MSKKILLVDDNPIVRLGTRRILENHPEITELYEAVDGLDAIEKAEVLNPHLVVLDLSMPRLNGLAAAGKLKAMKPSIKIILFTMFAEVVPPDIANEIGIDAVVSKTDFAGLKRHAAELLERSKDARP